MAIVKCCFKSADVSEVVEVVFQKCTDAGCCCGCISALRPRYKRLVDNIFPVAFQDGLVKANMEKLTFYSLSSPEKLDRIGEYLYLRAARDINRKRYGYVIIAMEAMDQLLLACHAQTLNLFVESFLKMVQKLLESTEPQLQILATTSFVKFANIEEDTPSYHRRYDFFVSKFSSMCHSGQQSGELRNSIRVAGIRGLQAVVRKTVSDDLVENIWEPVHMDKIVPSLLFNMQDSSFHKKESSGIDPIPDDPVDPPMLAETCMRELVGRASFGHVRAVLKPVLRHFDLHKLWVPNEFAIHTFRIIIFSVQAQYSYTVVELLMAHLDENKKSSPTIRTSIVDVLSKIIAIAAGESVGPSVLEIINSLLSHLRESVRHGLSQSDEKQYQDSLINALGEFANHLPDYQKIEIMMFIMSKIPYPLVDMHSSADNMLQSILLKSLLKVGTKYQTIQLNTTFPVSFLEPLLNMSLSPDPEMRLLVQKILHTLIDRHHNLEKLSKPGISFMELELVLEKSSRPDLIFINKHGAIIYNALYTGLTLDSNSVENIESVYTTLALLCVELACMETIIDLIQLVLGVQSLALNSAALSIPQKFQLHAVVAALLLLIPNVVHLQPLADYIDQVVGARAQEAAHLLPDLHEQYGPAAELGNKVPHLMFDKMAMCEYLKGCGVDVSRLEQSSPYSGSTAALPGSGLPGSGQQAQHRHSWVEASARGSVVELVGGIEQPDSVGNSPLVARKVTQTKSIRFSPLESDAKGKDWDVLFESFRNNRNDDSDTDTDNDYPCYEPPKYPEEELTFESMKRVLTESAEARKEAEAEKREELSRTFRTATFSELVRRTQPKHDILQNKLNEIFSSLSPTAESPSTEKAEKDTPVYEQNFPELFLH